jgi:hypothetical protein
MRAGDGSRPTGRAVKPAEGGWGRLWAESGTFVSYVRIAASPDVRPPAVILWGPRAFQFWGVAADATCVYRECRLLTVANPVVMQTPIGSEICAREPGSGHGRT